MRNAAVLMHGFSAAGREGQPISAVATVNPAYQECAALQIEGNIAVMLAPSLAGKNARGTEEVVGI